uniref:F-box domain-containing protein n=1 Tax=Arundo donax TaxID=35708 RepID=A0A0A8XNB6_ARUDO
MATCSRAVIMSSLCGVLAIQPKDLWFLVFRVLPKLLGLPPSLLKKFRKYEHVHPLHMETMVSTLPELPQDTLMDIFANLDIPDLMRIGSVCSSWRSAYTCLRNLGKYKQSQTPCLLYTSESAGQNVACLYSLVENRTYKLTLPEPPICSRFLIGSSNGWLITADERSELHLVNPITGEQIALPSVITMEHVKPITDGSGIVHKYELSDHTGETDYEEQSIHALNGLREHLYYKAFLFPDRSTGSYIVVLIHNPYCQLSFARAGDDKWTWLPPNTCYRDCIFMDGLLYALTSHGEIDAFDLTASTITMKVIVDKVKHYIYDYESMYIIRAPWGDLLQVWRTIDVPRQEDEEGDAPEHSPAMCLPCTLKIEVYKVDMEAKELIKINSLPYHVLFLGHNNSLCLSAEEHPQLKANHVYFTDDHDELVIALKNYSRDIGVMDLENSTRKKIVDQIWSNWPCPTWITPSLTKINLAFSK